MNPVEFVCELPPGTGFDGLGRAIADIIQHKRVWELHIKGRTLRARTSLREGETLLQPHVPETDLKDVARAASIIETVNYTNLAVTLLETLAQASRLNLYPIGWLSNKVPELYAATSEPHPGLGEDYWMAGLPGYLSSDFDADTLLLFAGFERDNMRSAFHIFRLLPESPSVSHDP